MTLDNKVICDGCSESTKPPRNEGWQVAFAIGPDGVNVSELDYHLCESCRTDVKRWVRERREQFDKARAKQAAARPS